MKDCYYFTAEMKAGQHYELKANFLIFLLFHTDIGTTQITDVLESLQEHVGSREEIKELQK